MNAAYHSPDEGIKYVGSDGRELLCITESERNGFISVFPHREQYWPNRRVIIPRSAWYLAKKRANYREYEAVLCARPGGMPWLAFWIIPNFGEEEDPTKILAYHYVEPSSPLTPGVPCPDLKMPGLPIDSSLIPHPVFAFFPERDKRLRIVDLEESDDGTVVSPVSGQRIPRFNFDFSPRVVGENEVLQAIYCGDSDYDLDEGDTEVGVSGMNLVYGDDLLICSSTIDPDRQVGTLSVSKRGHIQVEFEHHAMVYRKNDTLWYFWSFEQEEREPWCIFCMPHHFGDLGCFIKVYDGSYSFCGYLIFSFPPEGAGAEIPAEFRFSPQIT